MPQINQYANTATSVTDADWLDLDKNLGGSFQSQKLSLPVLGDSLQAYYPSWGKNIGNSDLPITDAIRTLDFDSNSMDWSNIKEFSAEATTLPSMGNSSYDFKAFGNTIADINFRIGNQSGDHTIWFGDGKIQHDGYFNVNDTSGNDIEHRFSSNGLNTYFTINSTTYSQLALLASNSFVWSMQTVDTDLVIERINKEKETRDVANNTIAGYENLNTASAAHYEVLPTLIGSTGATDSSAILEARSTTKGFLPPRMTEAQMNAITSPAEGLEVFNTTRGELMYYDAVWGWHPVGTIKPYWGYSYKDELFGTATTPWSYGALNGGTRTLSLPASTIFTEKRAQALATGVNANGESLHYINNFLLLGTGLKKYSTRVLAKDLSTGTDRFVFRSGYMNSISGLAICSGVYFVYDEGGVFGTSTASPNWLCVTRNGSTPTIVDSGVAVKSETLGQQPQTLEVLVNGSTYAKFYIDGIVVATITTTMPTATITGGVYVGEIMSKQAGTTSRETYVDYAEAKEKFSIFR